MKPNRSCRYNGSSASFPWELVGAVPLLLLGGVAAMKIPAAFPEWPGSAIFILAFAGVAGLLILKRFSNSGCHASPWALVVHGPVRSRHILYGNISRVDRVRRVARTSIGGVRITFRHGIQTHTLALTPECPESLVSDILEHCPHLSRARTLTLVRDRSFKDIKSPFLKEAGDQRDIR